MEDQIRSQRVSPYTGISALPSKAGIVQTTATHNVIPKVNPHNLNCLFPSLPIKVPPPQAREDLSSENSGTKPSATVSGWSGRSREPNLYEARGKNKSIGENKIGVSGRKR